MYVPDPLNTISSSTGLKAQHSPLQSVIDTESSEKIKSSPGYRQWAAIFNLKQSEKALILIQQYGGIEAFDEVYKNAIGEKLSLPTELNGLDAEIKSLSTLRNHLRIYGRTTDVFQQYRALGEKQRPKFYADHKEVIDTHRAAKKALSLVDKPVPAANHHRRNRAQTGPQSRGKRSEPVEQNRVEGDGHHTQKSLPHYTPKSNP